MPSTLKLLNNLSTSKMINAFTTNRNRPSVTIVTGKVKTTKTGFTRTLRIDNTAATIIAPTYPSTLTPLKNSARIKTAIAFTNNLMIRFMNLI